MVWPILAAAAIGGLSSASGAKSANAQSRAEYINALNNNVATNEAIGEANLTNTIRTGFRAGILSVQRGQARLQATRAGIDIGQLAKTVLSQNTASAAAAGTVGASVDAVAKDTQKKMDEALIENEMNLGTQEFNFDIQLNDIVNQGLDSLQTARTMDYTGVHQKSVSGAFLSGAASSLAMYGMSYMSANMSLGLQGTSAGTNILGGGGWVDAARNAATYGGKVSNWYGVTNY